MAGILLLPEFLQGSPAHKGQGAGWESLKTMTFLFTDMAGNIPFLKIILLIIGKDF